MAIPALSANSPSAGYISWAGFSIQYNGVPYSVAAGNSNQKFIYWRFNAGAPTMEAANLLPDGTPGHPAALSPDDLLLFLNKDGIPINAQSASVLDGDLVVSGSILANAIGANQISAGHIVSGAIDTTKLAAYSVSANKLQIGSFDNLVADPTFLTALGSSATGSP